MFRKPENFDRVIALLGKMLQGKAYAFRGTASLVLQGLEMNVDDIDIVCDKNTALICNGLLKGYLVTEVTFSESEKYKSYFGKFKIFDVPVEIMGEWQIKDTKGNWSEPLSGKERIKLGLLGEEIYVTTIESELAVFAKMGCWTAYQKILRQVKEKKETQPKLF